MFKEIKTTEVIPARPATEIQRQVYKCDICDFTHRHDYSIRNHIKSHHIEIHQIDLLDTEEKANIFGLFYADSKIQAELACEKQSDFSQNNVDSYSEPGWYGIQLIYSRYGEYKSVLLTLEQLKNKIQEIANSITGELKRIESITNG